MQSISKYLPTILVALVAFSASFLAFSLKKETKHTGDGSGVIGWLFYYYSVFLVVISIVLLVLKYYKIPNSYLYAFLGVFVLPLVILILVVLLKNNNLI